VVFDPTKTIPARSDAGEDPGILSRSPGRLAHPTTKQRAALLFWAASSAPEQSLGFSG